MAIIAEIERLQREVERLARAARAKGDLGCTRGMRVQSVVFSREFGSISAMKAWLRKHRMAAPKADRRANTVRFRQESPRRFSMMRTISPTPLIQMVVGCPTPALMRRKERRA